MKLALATAGVSGALALGAAQRPAALAQASPGLWEISGLPGGKAAQRVCVADLIALARYEHRDRACSTNVIRDDGKSTVIDYSCGGAGFGHSEVAVITPRSLKIDTQGISGGLPFAYVLQARRVGDCPGKETASRH